MFGLNAEGLSSATFTRIMGPTKAARLLLFNETLTAKEAYEAGLVSKLIPTDNFEEETKKLLSTYSTFSVEVRFRKFQSHP